MRADYTTKARFFGSSTPAELAKTYDTPLYVYNEKILRRRCQELIQLSAHAGFRVNYSVKANSNPALLKIIRDEGLLVDAMSPGELAMDLMAGYTPDEILYISNNNTVEEMQTAAGCGCLTSLDSLSQLDIFGSLNPGARVMARINPGIGDGHDEKVVTGGNRTKFGINKELLPDLLSTLARHQLRLAGLNQHIGSLFMAPGAFLDASAILLDLAASLPSHIFSQLEILDFGGGFGIPYHKYDHEKRLDMADLGQGLHALISDWASKTSYEGKFLIEPGRYVAAECGLLLGRVTAVKNNGALRFVGTDIGFNVLQRPVMYGSFHDVEVYGEERPEELQTIVGNICESGDILARDRMLPGMLPGDLLGILDTGAYGFSMASSYNCRLLPAEVLIRLDGTPELIRRRQTVADLQSCFPPYVRN